MFLYTCMCHVYHHWPRAEQLFLLLYLSLTLLLEFNKARQAPFTSHTRVYVCACVRTAEMSKEKEQYEKIVARRRLVIGFLHAYMYIFMFYVYKSLKEI